MKWRWIFLILLVGCGVSALGAEEDDEARKKSADYLMVYYRSPEPDRFPELLQLMDESVSQGTRSVFGGFMLELFRANPERVPEWLKMLDKCGDPATRLSLKLIAAALYPKYRHLIADLPADIPPPERFEEFGRSDPEFTWGRFFATGDAKHIGTLLRFALSQHHSDGINIAALIARWSLFAMSRQQPEVEKIFRELLSKCSDDELKYLFTCVDDEDRARLLDPERAAKLPAAKEELPDAPFAGLFRDWRDRALPRDTFRRRFDDYVKELVKLYPKSSPDDIREFMTRCNPAAGKPRSGAAAPAPCADPWAEAVRAARLYERDRNGGRRLLRNLTDRLPRGDLLRIELGKMLRGMCKRDTDEFKRCDCEVAEDIEVFVRAGGSPGSPVYWQLYDELLKCFVADRFWGDLEQRLEPAAARIDPWFLAMVRGHAAIKRAWESRGSGWGDSVTAEGWKGFGFNLDKARMHLNEAADLFPGRYCVYTHFITVEMGASRQVRMVDAFKKAVWYDAADRGAWSAVLWGLLPRWGGSAELIKQLAVEALDCPQRDAGVAERGYQALADLAYYRDDYRWQRVYLDPEVRFRADRLFEEHEQRAVTPEQRRKFLWQKFCRQMALLEYDAAAETFRACGGGEPAAKDRNRQWRFASVTGIGTVGYDDPAMRLRVFTGKYAARLRAAERAFLVEEDGGKACGELAAVIREGGFAPDEKEYLIDLYGRWRMDRPPSRYCDERNGKYISSYNVAISRARKHPAASEMEALGHGIASEKFPGERVYTIAMYGTDVAALRRYHAGGARIDLRHPKFGFEPIHVAAANGHAKMVEVLLELGIPIETRCRDGHSPLHLAASFKHFETVRLLIDYGADPNAQDNEGDFCLLYLPQVRAPLMFYQEFLAHSGIKVNLRNRAGESAMHYMASFNADPEIWKAFVDAGADCNLRDNRGRTPLDVAEEKNSTAAAEFLRSIGAKHGAELPPFAAPPRPRTAEPVKTEIPDEYWYMGGVAALMALMLILAGISFCRRKRG